MSRLKLPDFVHKRGVVVVISLFVAFSIILAGTYAWLSLVQRVTNNFEYNPTETCLTVKKSVSEMDFRHERIEPPEKLDEYKQIPFEFTVTIDGEPDEEYNYVIYDSSGKTFDDYPHAYAEPFEALGTIEVQTSGKIKSGGTIYLRDGDTAVVYSVPAGAHYSVTEKDYVIWEEIPGVDPTKKDFDFGCENPEHKGEGVHVHDAAIARATGWSSLGENASGYIREDGKSEASFTNTFIPDKYEITISSLVVVDRIVQKAEPRLEAGEEIIDYSQPFPVKVTIGDDIWQSYYYEVVHIDEAERENLDTHEDKDDYYRHNDPHYEWHLPENEPILPYIAAAGMFNLNGISPVGLSITPPLFGGTQPKDPLHYPSAYERRLRGVKGYSDNLKKSEGNVIEVELHHQSALIIYGIPVLTEYIAEQNEEKNGIYTLHSYYKEVGRIRPDLDAVPDPNYNEYIAFNTNSAGGVSAMNNNTEWLWRTRADIFNYPPNGVKTIEIEKRWSGGSSSGRPSSVKVDILNAVTRGLVKSDVKVSSSKDTVTGKSWYTSVKVPETDADGNEIFYTVREHKVSGYTSKVTESTGSRDSFIITNTYRPGVSTDDHDNDNDSSRVDPVTTGKGTLTVTKKVGGDEADRYKRFKFTAVIGRFKYKITLADGEKYSFTNIPAGTRYSVTEANYSREGYTTTSTGSSGTISNGVSTAAFVNTKGGSAQAGNSLTVTKTISGRFVDTVKAFNFTAKIGQDTHTFTLRHGESKTFYDIPTGTAYTVTEDDYSAQAYATVSKNLSGTMTAEGATAAFTNEYISDTLPEPDSDAVRISGTKTWVHGSNTEHPQSITVFVMNGGNIVTRKTVTAKENWQYVFNLPRYGDGGKEITYSINEEPVQKYVKSIKGYDITNTYDTSQNPGTGGGRVIWIWFLVLAAGSLGLRIAVFYRNKKRGAI